MSLLRLRKKARINPSMDRFSKLSKNQAGVSSGTANGARTGEASRTPADAETRCSVSEPTVRS